MISILSKETVILILSRIMQLYVLLDSDPGKALKDTELIVMFRKAV